MRSGEKDRVRSRVEIETKSAMRKHKTKLREDMERKSKRKVKRKMRENGGRK